MSEPKSDTEPAGDAIIIEFPDDPDLPRRLEAEELHLSVEPDDPPDTHSIHERWARLVDIGGGA